MAAYLKIAKRIANRSPHRSFKHCAVLMKGGSLISVGFNHGTTHAEMAALAKPWASEVKGCTMLSIRVTVGQELLANAKPCANCEAALREIGIKKVLYSTSKRTIEEMKL